MPIPTARGCNGVMPFTCTRSDMSGVKGIIGMHRFNICLVVLLSLSCSGVKTPLGMVMTLIEIFSPLMTFNDL